MVILYTRKTQKTGTQLSFHVQGDLEDWHTNVILYLDKKEEEKKEDQDTTVTIYKKRSGHNRYFMLKEIWKTWTQLSCWAQRNLEDWDRKCHCMHEEIWKTETQLYFYA